MLDGAQVLQESLSQDIELQSMIKCLITTVETTKITLKATMVSHCWQAEYWPKLFSTSRSKDLPGCWLLLEAWIFRSLAELLWWGLERPSEEVMITDEDAELEVESEPPPNVRLARRFKKFWPPDPAFMGSSARNKNKNEFHFFCTFQNHNLHLVF